MCQLQRSESNAVGMFASCDSAGGARRSWQLSDTVSPQQVMVGFHDTSAAVSLLSVSDILYAVTSAKNLIILVISL